jgi:hypothetical protein
MVFAFVRESFSSRGAMQGNREISKENERTGRICRRGPVRWRTSRTLVVRFRIRFLSRRFL